MKKIVLCIVCFVVVISIPLAAFSADHPNCSAVCNMDTDKFRINNPFPGINVNLSNLGAWTSFRTVLEGMGYQQRNCQEAGCTLYGPNPPVKCSFTPCKFPNTNGQLVSQINVNWVY